MKEAPPLLSKRILSSALKTDRADFLAQIAPIFRANFNFALKVQIFVTFELFVPQKWLTYQIKGLISLISEMP